MTLMEMEIITITTQETEEADKFKQADEKEICCFKMKNCNQTPGS